jgi:hypothetical protein
MYQNNGHNTFHLLPVYKYQEYDMLSAAFSVTGALQEPCLGK